MKKNNKFKLIILSLILGIGIFLIIDWVYYMNYITGDEGTAAFLFGGILLLVSSLYLLLNEADKRTISDLNYKKGILGNIKKVFNKFLEISSKYLVLASLVIIILSRFV